MPVPIKLKTALFTGVRHAFAHRGEIGGGTFLFLYPFASPKRETLLTSLFCLIPGIIIRILARGQIGKISDSFEIKCQEVIRTGIFKLRHPLYLGNFFLTLGVLTASNPPPLLFFLIVSGFFLEYTLFAIAEEKEIAGCGPAQSLKFRPKNCLWEWKTLTVVGIIYFLLFLKMKLWHSL